LFCMNFIKTQNYQNTMDTFKKIGNLFLPFQNLHIFGYYLNIANDIAVSRRRTSQYKLYFYQFVMLYYAAQHLYLWQTSLTDFERIIFFDLIHFVVQFRGFYLIISTLICLLIYINYVIFLTVKPKFLILLNGILFQTHFPLLDGISYKNYIGHYYIRKMALFICNILNGFIVIHGISVLFCNHYNIFFYYCRILDYTFPLANLLQCQSEDNRKIFQYKKSNFLPSVFANFYAEYMCKHFRL